jgi:hypothetical protein
MIRDALTTSSVFRVGAFADMHVHVCVAFLFSSFSSFLYLITLVVVA